MLLINNLKRLQRRKEQIEEHTSESSVIHENEFITEVNLGGSNTLVLCNRKETGGMTLNSVLMEIRQWGMLSSSL